MLDKVEIKVIAGKGGDGATSFRREKFVPLGGPDGGDGGDGGNVVFRADGGKNTLIDYHYKKIYKAGDGGDGANRKKHGKKGKDLVLTVPPGSVISVKDSQDGGLEIYDLLEPGQEVIAVRGGKGGLGNTHFTSSTNQAPRIAQKGEPGEEKELLLELKIIADVGVIGLPNAGKSSLLASVSAASPRVEAYPFTTLEPILGVVNVGNKSFVLAEIPGLISGAHLGKGLGHDFLRHALRTRVFIHIVDGSSPSPAESLIQINAELGLFDPGLTKKPQLVVVNKVDLNEVKGKVAAIKADFKAVGVNPLFISAKTGKGVAGLMEKVLAMLEDFNTGQAAPEDTPAKVFRPEAKGEAVKIYREGGIFVIRASGLERLIDGSDSKDPEVRRQLMRRLRRPSVGKALEKAGALPGDRVRCSNMEWEF